MKKPKRVASAAHIEHSYRELEKVGVFNNYRELEKVGVFNNGTPEQQAAEDAALRAKWVTHPSDDPLWKDLARVATRMLSALDQDIGLELCATFIRSLPPRLQFRIAVAWADSALPHEKFIGKGALIEFSKAKDMRAINSRGAYRATPSYIGQQMTVAVVASVDLTDIAPREDGVMIKGKAP